MAKIIQTEPSPLLYAKIRKRFFEITSLPLKYCPKWKGFEERVDTEIRSSSEAENYQPIMELLKGVKPSYVNF